MKTTVKIAIIVFSIIAAIGFVMVYARTKVEPPSQLKQILQYQEDIVDLSKEIAIVNSADSEDELLNKGLIQIHVFVKESKMQTDEADSCMDLVLRNYSACFLRRCYASFNTTDWSSFDHDYMLSQADGLIGLTHFDNTLAFRLCTIDSLKLVINVINDYRDAQRISMSSFFNGYRNAGYLISKAEEYSNAKYLSNITSLVFNLKSLKNRLASSCYNYAVTELEKLEDYWSYSKGYYFETLVPHVNQVLKDYDDNAASVFGSKQDISHLWSRARDSYRQANNYYN